MRAKEGMLAVMTPTWTSTRLAIGYVSQYTLRKEVGGERIVRHELKVEEVPSHVHFLEIIVHVAEVDAHCGGYDGSAYPCFNNI